MNYFLPFLVQSALQTNRRTKSVAYEPTVQFKKPIVPNSEDLKPPEFSYSPRFGSGPYLRNFLSLSASFSTHRY